MKNGNENVFYRGAVSTGATGALHPSILRTCLLAPVDLGEKLEIIAKMRFEVYFWAQSRRLAPVDLKSY